MIKARVLTKTALTALLFAACTIQAAEVSVRAVAEPNCEDPNTTCSKCVYIDLFDAAHATAAPTGSPWILPNINGGKGVSAGTLINGKTYLVTITGWVSYWFKSTWDRFPPAGLPLQPPKYYSDGPGAPAQANQTWTGYDWQCLFGFPQFVPSSISLPSPYSASRVSLDGGVTYGDLPALGGLTCSPDHTYRFLIVGKGLPAYFKISDTGPTYDNYGKYKICVQLVCCGEAGCADLVPAPQSVSPSQMTDGVFDPRLLSEY